MATMETATAQEKKEIYLIPGQGADCRCFKNLHFDTSKYNAHFVEWKIPKRKETMKGYARELLKQIDTSQAFYIIGVSLGGMIATEISKIAKPEKTIIISSAKNRNELPKHYRFQRFIPIYMLIPKRLIKWSSYIAQPLFEPDRKKEKATCKAMLKAKDPRFLKRTIDMIIKWERTTTDSTIIHIHGNNDHTIPIKNVNSDYLINNGSHMMILTRTNEISKIIIPLLDYE